MTYKKSMPVLAKTYFVGHIVNYLYIAMQKIKVILYSYIVGCGSTPFRPRLEISKK
jgi:hypothetical protein